MGSVDNSFPRMLCLEVSQAQKCSDYVVIGYRRPAHMFSLRCGHCVTVPVTMNPEFPGSRQIEERIEPKRTGKKS